MHIILILGRILFGGYFVYSGLNHFFNFKALASFTKSKKVPMPEAAVVASGLLILLGGLGVLFNIYMAFSLLLISIFLLVISFIMHAFWSEKDQVAKMNDQINFGKNMALLGACLLMIALI